MELLKVKRVKGRNYEMLKCLALILYCKVFYSL